MSRSRISAGSAYYGGADPRHLRGTRGLLSEQIPFVAIRGCAYPEMARAHVVTQAMEFGVECLVIIDPDIAVDASEVRRIGELALSEQAIVTATIDAVKGSGNTRRYVGGCEKSYFDVEALPWQPENVSDLSFAAVPLSALEKMAASDARDFTNSPIVRTTLSKNNRPFFSPWQKAPGTLRTPPIAAGVYCNPDRAFLLRAQAAGVPIVQDLSARYQSLGSPGYSVRIAKGSADRRREHGVPNYALCVPTFGALDVTQQDQIFELEKAGVSIVELHNCPHIDLARAELTRIALEVLGADGVFFLDHDIVFRPKDMVSLCLEAEERQDVVAAAYCMRKSGHALIGAIDDAKTGPSVAFFEGGSVYPALYAGLGFAAVPRAVIESLYDHHPELDGGMPGLVRPLYALDVNGGYYAGEDVSFCARVQGLTVRHFKSEAGESTPNGMDWIHERTGESPTGHRVWIDTRVRIFHRGSYDYAIEDQGIVVPRYQSLDARVCRTRQEVQDTLKLASNLAIETQMRSLGLDEKASDVHPIIGPNERVLQ